jgi:hypothetical protein
MDPARVRAYLQIACSGLGFDIGEVWWMLKDQDGEIESSASSDAGAVDASESENTHFGTNFAFPSIPFHVFYLAICFFGFVLEMRKHFTTHFDGGLSQD